MLTLTYQNYTIRLRSPDFGNSEKVEIRRINRKTRGGDLIVYRDPMWPKSSTFEFKFSYQTEVDLNRFLHFLRISLGQIVTLVDHQGQSWQGIILTPFEDVSQAALENYTLGFQFQVEL